MRRITLLFSLLVLLIPSFLSAGTTGKIMGKVLDAETKDPLPSVNVIVVGTTMGAATDLNGEYFILNVPAGSYSLRADMMGYKSMLQTDVRVKVDLTTTVDFFLETTVLDVGETVTVTAERPLIQKDLTGSRTIATGEEMVSAPVEDVNEVVGLTAGVSGQHFRGGRTGEVRYTLEGISLVDPMDGSFDSDIPLLSLEEMSVETGGMSAEYGNVQSGMVNMVMKEGGPRYTGTIRYKTNNLGSGAINEKLGNHYITLLDKRDNKMQTGEVRKPERLQNVEFALGGPEPIGTHLLKLPGRTNFFVAGESYYSHGRFPGVNDKKASVNGKLTYRPNPNYSIAITGLRTWRTYRGYSHLFKNTTFETVEGQDLNHDGDMTDAFSMLDHLATRWYDTHQFALTWTHTLSPRTFYELKLSQYYNGYHLNVDEKINEDTDGDGHLDLFINGVDVDGDGDNRHEDINGNDKWDWKVYGPDTDLFRDENENDFVDASEKGPRSTWMPWEDLPFGRYRDTNDFYLYGQNQNLSYPRYRWQTNKRTITTAKLNLISQVHPRHQIKTGFQFDYMVISSHLVDLASGGNVYGENFSVFPNQGAVYVEDKMEYEGMILNLGMRYDYFDANFDNYPADVTNPVPDSVKTVGGIINNPITVPIKDSWSPRLGVAFPITEKDLLHFSYGKYFQQPNLQYAFRNVNFDLSGAFGLMGNANIDPERTTAYEIGVKHQFSDNLMISAVGYYKDITGLTDVQRTYYTLADWYGLYINTDYGNIRGFEINLYKRPSVSDFLAGSLNYTYSVAKGKSSSSRQNYDMVWAGDIIPTTESYLDWDQRHVINANLNFRVPARRHWLGTSVFDDAGLNLIYKFGSGYPYSPPKRSKEPEINTERLPYTMTLDLTFDKRFHLGGRTYLTFFVWVNNLLDRINVLKNAFDLYGDVNWYDNYAKVQKRYDDGEMSREDYMSLMDVQDPLDRDGDGNYEEGDGEVDLNKKYPEMTSKLDPRVHGARRTIRLGVSLQF